MSDLILVETVDNVISNINEDENTKSLISDLDENEKLDYLKYLINEEEKKDNIEFEFRIGGRHNKFQLKKIGTKRWENICSVLKCITYAFHGANFCIEHGGKKKCIMENCTKYCVSPSEFCIKHGGGARCKHIDENGNKCKSQSKGKSGFCIKHGGGKRCAEQNCTSSAQGNSDFCVKHGGRQCKIENCTSGTQGNTDFCIKHGGGNRCQFINCNTSACKKSNFCTKHGGGKYCIVENCNTLSRGWGQDFCVKHGGGKRCQSERCSIFEIPDYGGYKYNGQYLCNYCFYQIYPDAKSNKLFIRQEHLILAEIQRLIDDDLNAVKCIWDCPISCDIKKRPDLMYELEDIYISIEVDEKGHDQQIERVLEFRNILDKPFIMFRINPNLVEKPLLKKNHQLMNGEIIWKATENFEPLMSKFKDIILDEIDNIRDRDFIEGDLPCYTEVGFLFNKYPTDRGNIIENDYGYIIYS